MADNDESVYASTIRQNLGPVVKFLDDPSVTEILVNGPDEIFVERFGKLEKTTAKFQDEDALQAAIRNIAQSVQRRISEREPTLDARLPTGQRIAAVFPPCSRKGATLSIRKFSNKKISFKDYVEWKAITPLGAQFLDVCMYLGKNIIVSGGTGSGKTTLLSLLGSRIPKGQRIIVIEDSTELTIDYEHIVWFETRHANEQGEGAVTIKDLLKSSLRLRPDRIIVGEVRGSEALELIAAMNTGHKGCMGTVHANSPADGIVRLEALAQGGDGSISERALRYQVASAVEIIIQVSRFQDGSRRVEEISEVLGLDTDGSYKLNSLFKMSSLLRDADGTLKGQLEPTGNLPSFMNEIEDNRLPFPRSAFAQRAKKQAS